MKIYRREKRMCRLNSDCMEVYYMSIPPWNKKSMCGAEVEKEFIYTELQESTRVEKKRGKDLFCYVIKKESGIVTRRIWIAALHLVSNLFWKGSICSLKRPLGHSSTWNRPGIFSNTSRRSGITTSTTSIITTTNFSHERRETIQRDEFGKLRHTDLQWSKIHES